MGVRWRNDLHAHVVRCAPTCSRKRAVSARHRCLFLWPRLCAAPPKKLAANESRLRLGASFRWDEKTNWLTDEPCKYRLKRLARCEDRRAETSSMRHYTAQRPFFQPPCGFNRRNRAGSNVRSHCRGHRNLRNSLQQRRTRVQYRRYLAS